MSKILFGTKIDIITAATPSNGGYLIAYDIDGLLKQKDEFGNITTISSEGLTPTLADVLSAGNSTGAESIFLSGETRIDSSSGISFISLNHLNNGVLRLDNNDNYISIDTNDITLNTDALNISATSSNIVTTNGLGLVYGFDYSSNFVDNSVVSKLYVDGEINEVFNQVITEIETGEGLTGGGTVGAVGIDVLTNPDSLEVDLSNQIRLKDTIQGARYFEDSVIIGGDLTINGTTTQVNTEELEVADNIITLNATFSGVPFLDAGIKIERGDEDYARLIWNETQDVWTAGLSGSEHAFVLYSGMGLTKSQYDSDMALDYGIFATGLSHSNGEIYVDVSEYKNLYELAHSELIHLISINGLEEGANYLITDFQTIYVQPDFNANGSQKAYTIDSVKTGTVEPLLVKATSNSTISHEAKSILFPDDTIEYLHEVENLESLGEFTKGKIIRRKDRVGNDIPFDFRQVKFKRYETTLNSGNFHEYKDNAEASDEFYIFGTYDPVNPFDYESSYSNSIGRYGYNSGNIWLINTVLFGGFVDNHIQADSQNNTFTGYCEGNSFGQYLWNNLFSQLFGTTFGYYCADNNINFCYNCTFDDEAGDNTIDDVQYCTFGKSFRDNDITYAEGVKTGLYFENNTIGNCYSCTFDDDAYNNVMKNSTYDTFGKFFTDNIFTEQEVNNGVIGGGTYDSTQRSEGNTIGNDFRYNTIGFKFKNNKIGDYFGESLNGNILSDEFQDNKIGNYTNSNIFGNKFKDNIINNGFSSNTIGEFFSENKIGDYFSDNDIGDWFYLNIINNYFTNNTIGDDFGSRFKEESTGNIIGNNFTFNTIGDMFGGNKVGENFNSNNILGSEVKYNDFGHGFINNLIDEYSTNSNFIGNKFEYNTVSSVFSNNFQGNTIILSGTRFINLLPEFRYNIIKIDSGSLPGFSTTTLDFTGSTASSHVYQMGYTKEIFKRLDGGLRLKYIDNTDATVVVNIID